MEYCPHCMNQASGDRCPHCGGELSWTGKQGIDLPVGTVLTGGGGLRAYQIGAARGMGGFGITYIALELSSHRRVAVKEYFPTRCAVRSGNGISVQTMTGQEEMFRGGMNSFLKEGKMLLAQDDLPSVVRVMDYFQANGTAYLVMEYLDGVPLHAQMIRMGGRIPVGELMPRLAPLVRDIGQLHQRGVLHRDISPDNIMWMADGGLKLLDFGSARSMENGKSMTVLMKQGFSPIEQYRSKGQTPCTDVYALAATIYYCVTGVIPPSAVERLDDDPLQSPVALGAELTVDQETALLWALSLQPKARPQSMEEFAGMLFKEEPEPQPVPEPAAQPFQKTERAQIGTGFAVQPQPEPVRVQPEPPRAEPVPPQPEPEPVPVQPEPPRAEPAAAQIEDAPPDRPAETGSNSPSGTAEHYAPPGRLEYLGTSRTAKIVITAAVAVAAALLAKWAVDAWLQLQFLRRVYVEWWRVIAIEKDYVHLLLMHVIGGAGFAACVALLIALRKKTAPYIGAIASLVVWLLGGMAVGPCTVVGLSAAAVTLYWLAHCEPERLRETVGRTAVTAAVAVMAAVMAIYAVQALLEIYIIQTGW